MQAAPRTDFRRDAPDADVAFERYARRSRVLRCMLQCPTLWVLRSTSHKGKAAMPRSPRFFSPLIRSPKDRSRTASPAGTAHPTSPVSYGRWRMILSLCAAFLALALPHLRVAAEELPTISASQLPGSLQELYAKEVPGLGQNGHCAAGFDSRTDGLKMAFSCSIYVRSSAQGARLAVKLCNERADFLKVKARCSLIVD